MKYTLKDISHFVFFEALEKYVEQIEILLNSDSTNEDKFTLAARELIQQSEVHLSKYIAPDSKEILTMLNKRYHRLYDHDYSSFGFDSGPGIKKERGMLDRFHKSIKILISYLSIIDTLFDPDAPATIESISEKSDFILIKLNQLFGEDIYSIEKILELNGIKFRSTEPREIAEDLSRRGYIILNDRYGNSDKVQISIKGANYVERKNRKKKTNKSTAELGKKIDDIIDHLTKIGYGQEIIFDEIGELKDLQHKLSKKTWSQLLKGKLLDLALEKIISKETATFIYDYLTNSHFKLLEFP